MTAEHRDDRATRRVRTLVRALVILVVALVVVLSAATWALLFRVQHDIGAGEPVTVEVVPGATTAAIAGSLVNLGVIDNQYMFRLRTRLQKADGALSPGVYELETGMSYGAVIERLTETVPADYVTVPIPEGLVVEQVAERLERAAGIPADETLALAKGGAAEFAADHPFLQDAYDGSLEGYLFPKTYQVRKGAKAREALELMLVQFEKEISDVSMADAEARGRSVSEVVVMASIIEREAQLDEERPLVASVIENRLGRGMLLEIDATVEYVLPGNRFRLRYSDLTIDSPYNTYRVGGLPPGPISSPGLASLKAAVSPANTDYLYYVLTGKDGSHTFVTNKKDFLTAKQKSKEVFGR